jgi:tRNA A37 threonylcarbamoyladenosine synthetase subunit TsaC/SUA5/YrdC
VFTTGVKDGAYKFAEAIPPGPYVVLVGGKVPERYRDAGTSGIRIEVAGGANTFDLALKSK